jgi:oligogalacturonide lyase
VPAQRRRLAERSTYRDPDTGATVTRWTGAPGTNQHLYFTTFSVTADDRWLVFISDRDGDPNLYAVDRADGSIRQLSDNKAGLLRSYVYPLGGRTGLSKASPCLDQNRNRLYYIQDDAVFAVDLDGEDGERRICALPAGWYGGYPHLSPDGGTLCVPLADPRAFAGERTQWEQLRTVPRRMTENGLGTGLYLVDVATGGTRVAAEVPFWVTHVQFDPAGTGRVVFNLEGHDSGGTPLPDRIWCLEPGGHFRPLAAEPAGEWRTHENWASGGGSIVYHGVRAGKAFVAARTWEGELLSETSIDGVEFWHATAAVDGRRMVVDRRDGMISLLDPGAPADCLVDLCRHDTTYDNQDAHAHPFTTPDGGGVVFTSNRTGDCQVYEVPVPAWLR